MVVRGRRRSRSSRINSGIGDDDGGHHHHPRHAVVVDFPELFVAVVVCVASLD